MDAPAIRLDESFLRESLTLFHGFKQSVHWDSRMRARKTASFGVSYDYSQMAFPEQPMPPEI